MLYVRMYSIINWKKKYIIICLLFILTVSGSTICDTIFSLTHICHMKSSTLTFWISPFPIEGYLVSFYNYYVL